VHTFETLPLRDQWDEPIPHRFLRCAAATDHAALLLPGAEVAFLHPALYYCVIECMRCQADILWVGYGARPQFPSLSLAEKAIQAKQDTLDACRALIGKSLGTLAMCHLLTATLVAMPVQAIWLIPLFQHQDLREQLRQVCVPSLFVIGTRDAHYDPAYVRELRDCYAGKGEALVIEGADHGLEVGAEGADLLGCLLGCLRVLEQVMCAIGAFLRS
jgi:pimeloyl-ACP methyl ester carboxylesterase